MTRITLKEWSNLHPYNKTTDVDIYYQKLANRLNGECALSAVGKELGEHLRKEISLSLTAYFEDVVSFGGLWKGYIAKNKELTGKYLPFYPIDEAGYYEDEVNFEDILHVIWLVIQRNLKNSTIMNPDNPGIYELTSQIYPILVKEFEKAPINDYFIEYIRREDHYTDLYRFKNLLNWFCFQSFLLGFEGEDALGKTMLSMEEKADDYPFDYSQLDYIARSEIFFNKYIGPLSIPAKDWFIAMLQGMEEDMSDIINLIQTIETSEYTLFLVESIDEKYIYLKTIDDESIKLLKDSFSELSPEALTCKLLIASLVKFDGEWNVNGISSWSRDEKPFQKRKKEKEDKKKGREIVFEKFMKSNKNKPVAYLANKTAMVQFFDKMYSGEFPKNFDGFKNFDEEDDYVLFVTPDTDMLILPNIAPCIKSPDNPMYNQSIAKKEAVVLLGDKDIASPRLIDYLLKNNLLPDIQINSLLGEKRGKELIQDNLEYWVRYFRQNI